MAKLTRSIEIDAPVEKVFDYALDVGKFWTSWPEEIAARDIVLTPDGVGTSARLFGHFLAIHMEGTIEYIEVVPNESIVAKIHWFGESPMWLFTFEPTDGGMILTAEAEWDVKLPVVGKRIEGMIVKSHEKGLESLLETVKSRVEAQVAAAA